MANAGGVGTAAAWLFVRGDVSVRMEVWRQGDAFQLRIFGPGKERHALELTDLGTLMARQSELESALIADGFSLEKFVSERRRWPR